MFGPAQGTSLAELLATIRKLYPQARVTDTLRDPNSPLGRANPRSMHMQGTPEDPRAVDVAPIPGVTFDQYVSSLKGAGVPVTQAFDEQKHPFPWTTGPNWHIGQGSSPVQPYYQPRTLGNLFPKPDLNTPMAVNNMNAPNQMTLADLPTLPEGNVPKHKGLFPGKDLAAILGIVGDAMTAYGGGQPVFGPAMLQRQRDRAQQEAEAAQARDRLAAQMAKSQEPPQFIQNAMAWAGLNPDQKRMVLEQQDAVNPINVATPMGTQNVPRIQHKVIGGKSYYGINGEWYEEGE